MPDDDVVAGDGQGLKEFEGFFGSVVSGETVVDLGFIPSGFFADDQCGLEGSGVWAGDDAYVFGCQGLDGRDGFG